MNRNNSIIFLFFVFFDCSPRDQTMQSSHRIIFFGDSITELGVQPNGFVVIVNDSFKSLGQKVEIIGAGISGNKVGDLEKRLDRDVLSLKPTIVIIYIGINDVWHYHFADRGLSGTSKEKFESGLNGLIRRIQSDGAKVILCTPSVIGEKHDGTNAYDALLDEYSAISRSVAGQYGVSVCDLRKEFLEYLRIHNASNAEKDILTNDGVHLNDAGNRFVAEQMIKALDGMGLFFPQK